MSPLLFPEHHSGTCKTRPHARKPLLLVPPFPTVLSCLNNSRGFAGDFGPAGPPPLTLPLASGFVFLTCLLQIQIAANCFIQPPVAKMFCLFHSSSHIWLHSGVHVHTGAESAHGKHPPAPSSPWSYLKTTCYPKPPCKNFHSWLWSLLRKAAWDNYIYCKLLRLINHPEVTQAWQPWPDLAETLVQGSYFFCWWFTSVCFLTKAPWDRQSYHRSFNSSQEQNYLKFGLPSPAHSLDLSPTIYISAII